MLNKEVMYSIAATTAIVLAVFLAPRAQAQYPMEGNSQGYNIEFITKINNLGSLKVLDVPLPILFGLTQANLTRNFGDPRSNGRTHEGLDIMAPMNAPVVTPTDAVVIRVGEGVSAGKYVYTVNPGGETFAYLHLSEIANIHEGDEIKKGTLVGYVGNTGNASGGSPHLHFQIEDATGFIDPYTRLTSVIPSADKINYLQNILSKATDEKKVADTIVALYRKELLSAQAQNIYLPASITNALGSPVPTPVTVAAPKPSTTTELSGVVRTLRMGLSGSDVKALQNSLGVSADGNFGPKTKAAVIAFQTSHNLTPDGVFGPMSRIALSGGVITLPLGCESTSGYSTVNGVKCTT